jgi:hypothetical protein
MFGRLASTAHWKRAPPIRLRLFFSCVAADQFALCDDMAFHRGVELAPLRSGTQIQFAIQRENSEIVPMHA